VIFPISVNILFTHAMLAPEGLPTAIFVIAANLFLAYAYRKNYATLVMAKPLA
jgi:putative oxidoreductase